MHLMLCDSENLLSSSRTQWHPKWVILDAYFQLYFSQNNNPTQTVTATQYRGTTLKKKKKKLGHSWKLFQNPAPPPSGGMFHWPVIFIVAVQNETVGSSRLKQSLYGGKNQYSNIRARLIRGSLLLRGHWGATAFKWGIQLWNIVWDELWWVSD